MTIALSQSLKQIDYKKLYDSSCITLFSYNWMLSYLIKYALLDYSHLSIDEINDSLSSRKDYTIRQEQVPMENTADISVDEGNRYYDILFSVVLKNKQGKQEKVYINVEIQNDYYPGYSLLNRGEYYLARIISRQYGREFEREDFNSIKKVYSIWICNYPSKKDSNTITRYPRTKNPVFGYKESKQEGIGKTEIIQVCLSNTREKCGHILLDLLNTVVDETIAYEEKVNRIETITGRKVQQKIKEEVSYMCNLSEGLARKYTKEGIQKGIISALQALIKNTKMDIETAMDAIGISEEEKDTYRKSML